MDPTLEFVKSLWHIRHDLTFDETVGYITALAITRRLQSVMGHRLHEIAAEIRAAAEELEG